jgi:hypothetical protein
MSVQRPVGRERPSGEGAVRMAGPLQLYRHLMLHRRDLRADSLPLMGSVWPTAIACGAYVYFCRVLGPR